MRLQAKEIAKIIGNSIKGIATDTQIDTLLTDSRDLTYPSSTIFFAIRTNVNDGHNYIDSLYSKGVRNFVIDEASAADTDKYPEAMFVIVPSVVGALQTLGKYARNQFSKPVVGITGSRGKTIQKEMLYTILGTPCDVVRSPRSYNSQIGVPLSLWQIDTETNLAIIEAGISQSGEMDTLEAMIKPTLGIFTSLTDEHSDTMPSLTEKATEKARLFKDCADVIIPSDTPNSHIIEQAVKEQATQARIVKVTGGNKAMIIKALDMLGADYDEKRLDHLPERLTSRIDVTETLKNCVVVYDSFTDDLRSLHDALNFTARHLTPGQTLTAIISSASAHYTADDIKCLLQAKGVKRLIGIGMQFDGMQIPGIKCEYYPTVSQFLDTVTISDFKNEVILVKGEAGSQAEDIKSLLEAPRHETVLEVDLGALTRNFNFFKSKVPQDTGIVCMVKAAGYGIGAVEPAKVLQNQGAAYLAVAVIDEGTELRRAGITMPIIVMNPIGTNYKALFENRLEPSVFSLRELRLLRDNALRNGVEHYPVHIKLDTGMHRLGFIPEEIDSLIQELNSSDTLRVKSIFSHLATSDCLDQDEYTEMQLNAFEQMSSRLMQGLPYKVLRHVLNTAGILRYPDHHYDMVRLGIGLYGVAPIEGYKLSTVATLLSTIISIKHWDAGITIGYGRKGHVEGPSEIATVAIGYADGLNRHLSNGGAYVMVNGHKCPIIGNICMDQCMVDVTGAGANIGDTVEIFGEQAPISRLSDKLDTIPYEILTSVSPRVKRIYFKE